MNNNLQLQSAWADACAKALLGPEYSLDGQANLLSSLMGNQEQAHMKVETILQRKGRDVVTISADTTVREAVRVICKRRIGAVIVVGSEGGVQGIFSERDLIMGIDENGAEILRMPVSAVMTKEVHSCTRQNTVIEVMGMMTRRRIRHVPVIEGGSLIGLVSIGDAVKHRIAETEHEAEALRGYIATG